MSEKKSIHGHWSNAFVFVLAAVGSAVGLGNIWKFPYITGEYGGGAFVLIYLVCILLIGIPVMMAEIAIGRRGRQSPINTMRDLASEENKSPLWQYMGWGGVLAGFLILSYYSVIAGWTLSYVFKAASGTFDGADASLVGDVFANLTGNPEILTGWHTLFMVLTMMVVARGVRGGLEKAVTLLMPALFALLLVMVGYAANSGGFEEGLNFLFHIDFNEFFYACDVVDGAQRCEFTGTPLLTALGHAFFTLSLGMGAIMVYGSYMPKNYSITKATFIIAGADTVVALLAGMAIFPIVFANGLAPGSGPGLIFQTLPIAFGNMAGGQFFGTLFFILLAFAAWSSAISLVEPGVAWLVENKGYSRVKATTVIGVSCWILGLGTVFSFNLWSSADYQLFGKTLFDLLDYLTANIMLPLGGLLIAIFATWVMKKESISDELSMQSGFSLWYFVTRFITPVAIAIVFLNAIGVI